MLLAAAGVGVGVGFALFGAGVGAFFAYVSAQQMIAPPDPTAAAQVLLRRYGAQLPRDARYRELHLGDA